MRLNRVLLLAASFSFLIFAMVFTVSCSGDDGSKGDKGDPGTICTVAPITGGYNVLCDGQIAGTLTNGNTPFIGPDGNWWIGTTNTMVNAMGGGPKGDTPTISPTTGNWVISGVDTGLPARGPAGPKGEQGAINGMPNGCLLEQRDGSWYTLCYQDGEVASNNKLDIGTTQNGGCSIVTSTEAGEYDYDHPYEFRLQCGTSDPIYLCNGVVFNKYAAKTAANPDGLGTEYCTSGKVHENDRNSYYGENGTRKFYGVRGFSYSRTNFDLNNDGYGNYTLTNPTIFVAAGTQTGGLISDATNFLCGYPTASKRYNPNVDFCQTGADATAKLCSGDTYDEDGVYAYASQWTTEGPGRGLLNKMERAPAPAHDKGNTYPVALIGQKCDRTVTPNRLLGRCANINPTGNDAFVNLSTQTSGSVSRSGNGWDDWYKGANATGNAIVEYDMKTYFCRPVAGTSTTAKVEAVPFCNLTANLLDDNRNMYDSKTYFCEEGKDWVRAKCGSNYFNENTEFCFKEVTPNMPYPYCTGGSIEFSATTDEIALKPGRDLQKFGYGGQLTTYDPRDAFCERRPDASWKAKYWAGVDYLAAATPIDGVQPNVWAGASYVDTNLTYKVNLCQSKAGSAKIRFNELDWNGSYCTGNTSTGVMTCSNAYEGPIDSDKQPVVLGITGTCSAPGRLTKEDCIVPRSWNSSAATPASCSDPTYTTKEECTASKGAWTPKCSDASLLTQSACETPKGTWTSKCSDATLTTQAACSAPKGTWTPKCSDATLTTQALCEAPKGIWDGTSCSDPTLATEALCSAPKGTWGGSYGECSDPTLTTQALCEAPKGTWGGSYGECSDHTLLTQSACEAPKGAWGTGSYGTCSDNTLTTQALCEAPRGTWTPAVLAGCSDPSITTQVACVGIPVWTPDKDYSRGVNCDCIDGAKTALSGEIGVVGGVVANTPLSKCGCEYSKVYDVIKNRCVCPVGKTWNVSVKECR